MTTNIHLIARVIPGAQVTLSGMYELKWKSGEQGKVGNNDNRELILMYTIF